MAFAFRLFMLSDHECAAYEAFVKRHQVFVMPILARRIAEQYVSNPSATVLDIGVGPGFFLEALAETMPQSTLIGLDINPKMLELSKFRLAEKSLKARLILGDIHHCPIPDNSIDIAVSYCCFHHFANLKQAISESYRVMKEGAELFIWDCNPLSAETIRYLYQSFEKPEYAAIIEKAARESIPATLYCELLTEQGFEVQAPELLEFKLEEIADYVDEIADAGLKNPPGDLRRSTFLVRARKSKAPRKGE